MKSIFKHLLRLALSVYFVLSVWTAYEYVFQEQDGEDKMYYLKSLEYAYTIMGSRHDLNAYESKQTAESCQTQDYYKLIHSDAVLEDVYCFHVINDTILHVYKRDCFTISHHRGEAFQNVKKSLTMFHGNPTFALRKKFMSRECMFKMDISLNTGEIHMKSVVQSRLVQFQDKLHARHASAQCLSDAKFYPVSYALSDREQCKEVLQILHSKFLVQQTPQDYIIKTDEHLGRGLDLVDELYFSKLLKTYNNGSLCGQIPQSSIIQVLTKKPILLWGHKLDFRIWILIVQIEPLIVYVYDYSGLMTCLDPYHADNLTQYNFNCNSGLAKDYWSQNRTDAEAPLTLEQIHQGWSFEDWGRYLKSQGLIDSDDWWKTTFLPLVEQKIAYFFTTMLRDVKSDARLSGLYAFDASIDADMNMQLFEINVTPNFFAVTNGNYFVQSMLHVDILKLLQMYLKQRYMKLLNHIQQVMVPQLKQRLKIDVHALSKVLQMEALPHKKIQQFFLIDFEKALRNCKPFLYDI